VSAIFSHGNPQKLHKGGPRKAGWVHGELTMSQEERILVERKASVLVLLPLIPAQLLWLFLDAPLWYWPAGMLVVLAIVLYFAIASELHVARGEFVWSWMCWGRRRIIYRRIRLTEVTDIRVEESYAGPYVLRITRMGRWPSWVGSWESQKDAESARQLLTKMSRAKN